MPTRGSPRFWTNASHSGPGDKLQARAGGDEPGAVEQHFTADFVGQFWTAQVALVDAVAGAIIQYTALPFFGSDTRSQSGIHHDQLFANAANLANKHGALSRRQVTVEVARENALERCVGHGQPQRVGDNGIAARQA